MGIELDFDEFNLLRLKTYKSMSENLKKIEEETYRGIMDSAMGPLSKEGEQVYAIILGVKKACYDISKITGESITSCFPQPDCR